MHSVCCTAVISNRQCRSIVADVVDTLAATGGNALKLVHTHDGAAAAAMALAYGTPKDRKRLVKGMKGQQGLCDAGMHAAKQHVLIQGKADLQDPGSVPTCTAQQPRAHVMCLAYMFLQVGPLCISHRLLYCTNGVAEAGSKRERACYLPSPVCVCLSGMMQP